MMKKCKWINGLLAVVAIGFIACGNAAGGGSGGGGVGGGISIRPNNYYEITGPMTIKPEQDSAVYMFIYNTGDAKITSDEYKNIYPLPNNSDPTILPNIVNKNSVGHDDNFSHYTCSLALESIRNEYKTLVPISSSSRAATSQYDKGKYKTAAKTGESAEFHVAKNGLNSTLTKITAYCRAFNDDCQVFVEESCYDTSETNNLITGYDKNEQNPDLNKIKITKKGAEDIAEKFSKIYIAEQALFGSSSLDKVNYPNIIETSEKITILISALGYTETSFLGGYYAPRDLFCNCADDGKILDSTTYSNQRQMFTINNVALCDMSNVYSTLGHEFNHMLNYINKDLINGGTYETWFTEMLSAMTEDFTPYYTGTAPVDGEPNSVQGQRIPNFWKAVNEGMIDWYAEKDITDKKNTLDSYSFAYTFGAYLIRNYGGVKLIHEIATNQYVNEEAINAALKSCGYSKETYKSVLQKFGLILVNYWNQDKSSPSLYKKVTGYCNGHNYTFSEILIPLWGVQDDDKEIRNNYISVHGGSWNDDGKTFYNGPFVLKPGIYQKYIRGGAFSASCLGSVKPGYTYSLNFNPLSNSNLRAYVYIAPYTY